jgi:hypothetical protein
MPDIVDMYMHMYSSCITCTAVIKRDHGACNHYISGKLVKHTHQKNTSKTNIRALA